MNRTTQDLNALCRSIATPWGRADFLTHYAPGLDFVSTPRHGAFMLSPERWAELVKAFPAMATAVDPGWLEEDCLWCLAPLTWPDLFTFEEIRDAVHAARARYSPPGSLVFLEATPAGRLCREIADHFDRTHSHLWERGGSGTTGNGWSVWFYRGKASRRVEITGEQYLECGQRWLTDEELARLAGSPAPFAGPGGEPTPECGE